MAHTDPTTEIDTRFSSPGATPVPWTDGRQELERAKIYWISTVRRDGRPHVTPLIGLWDGGAFVFTTGPEEQKGVNLAANPEVVITTGTNDYDAALDVMVEGRAERVTDGLEATRDAYLAKYGEEWRFEIVDGCFSHGGENRAYVWRVAPRKVLGFGRGGGQATHTRWVF